MDITKFTLFEQFLEGFQYGLTNINLDYRFLSFNSEIKDNRIRIDDFIPIMMQLKLYTKNDPNNPPRTDISYDEMAEYIDMDLLNNKSDAMDLLFNKSISIELSDHIIKQASTKNKYKYLIRIASNSSYPVKRFLHKYVDTQSKEVTGQLFGYSTINIPYNGSYKLGLSANPNIDDKIVRKYYDRPFDFMKLISVANISPLMVDKIISEKLSNESIEKIALSYIQNDHMDVDYYIFKFGHLNNNDIKIDSTPSTPLSKNIDDRFVKHFIKWLKYDDKLLNYNLLHYETSISKDLILDIIRSGYRTNPELLIIKIAAKNFSTDMIDDNPDIAWNYNTLSKSRGITKEYVLKDIEKGLNHKWNWVGLLSNKYSDITPEFVQEFGPENIKLKLLGFYDEENVIPYIRAVNLTPKFVIDHIYEMSLSMRFDTPLSIIYNNLTF